MPKTPIQILVVFWLALAGRTVDAQPLTEVADDRARQIENIARSNFESGRFNGGLLVADGEELIYKGAFGLSDRESRMSNSPDMPFPIRSLTKPFTAILILQLAERGDVDLEHSVAEYLPSFTSTAADRISLHDLLTHTSGLPDYILEIPGYRGYDPPDISADSALNFIAQLQMEFEPGEGYAYSNTGYVLLAKIVERVTGRQYSEMLEERIFVPLGMEDTRWTPLEYVPGMATQYRSGGTRVAPVIPHFPGDAGIMSTLDDMRRFANALGSSDLLSQEMWDRAFTPHTDPGDVTRPHPATRFPYGYGFAIADAPVGRVVMHAGLGYGGSAAFQRLIDSDEVVVLWNNIERLPPFIPEILPVLASPETR